MKRDPNADVDAFSHEQLRVHVDSARRHVAAIVRMLPGLVRFNEAMEKERNPIVDEDHAAALEGLLALMQARPAAFWPYHEEVTEWPDPDFTPEMGRELLTFWRILSPLAREMTAAAKAVTDHVDYVAAQIREGCEFGPPRLALKLADADLEAKAILGKKAYAHYARLYRSHRK